MKFLFTISFFSLFYCIQIKYESAISSSTTLQSIFTFNKYLEFHNNDNNKDNDESKNAKKQTSKKSKKLSEANLDIFDLAQEGKEREPVNIEIEEKDKIKDYIDQNEDLGENEEDEQYQIRFEGKYFYLNSTYPKNIDKTFYKINNIDTFNFSIDNNSFIIYYKDHMIHNLTLCSLFNIDVVNITNPDGTVTTTYQGGVENLGKYIEGHCFSLHGREFIYVVCHQDSRKESLLDSIIQPRLKWQRNCYHEAQKHNKKNNTTKDNNTDSDTGDGGSGEIHTTISYLPPKIKYFYLTPEPQQYQKCIIKSEDVNVLHCPNKVKIPSRVTMIMSAGTMNITNFYYSKILNLSLVTFYDIYPEDDKCVQIGCPFDCKDNFTVFCVCSPEMANQWLDDIAMFKSNCTRDATSYRKLKLARKIAQDKIAKEERYEQLLEEELKLKGENEIKEMKQKIEREKWSYDISHIQHKKIQAQNLLEKRNKEVDRKIKEIERRLNDELEEKRRKNKKRLKLLRMQQQIQLAKLEEEYTEIKVKNFKQNIILKKRGNYHSCVDNTNNNKYIQKYCKNAYKDRMKFLGICLQKENFCFMCCNNEFSDYYLDLKEDCYNKCADIDDKYDDRDINSILDESNPNNFHVINHFYDK